MGPKAFVSSIYCPWPLFTQEDLAERSPTRLYRDKETGKPKGQSQKKEEDQIKTVIELMGTAGAVLKLHHAMPTAIVFARRYFSVKAMQENDRFIVACACLFLAAKCEEELRALNDVCYQTYKARYKGNSEALKNMQNVEFFTHFKEIVLTAERSLLYALGFQMDIRHPYYWSTTILRRLGNLLGDGQPGTGPWWQEYFQKTRSSRTNFINDLYRRTTLVLRYDLRIISFAVIHLTIPIMYADIGRPTANHDKVPLIAEEDNVEPWYSYVLKTERPEVVEGAVSSTPSRASSTYEPEQRVTVSLLCEISKEIMGLYAKAKKAGQAPGGGAKSNPGAPETVGPDGPITPLLEEFGTPRSDGSPHQVDANGQPAANSAQPGFGAAVSAPGARTGLNPAAAAFVPTAAQPIAGSSTGPAPASSAQAGGHQPGAQQASRKRSRSDDSLQEQGSPSKRAASDGGRECSAGGFNYLETAGGQQPSADKQSHEGVSIPGIDMEVESPKLTAYVEPQCNGSSSHTDLVDTLPSGTDGPQPTQSNNVLPNGATALTNRAQPAGAAALSYGVHTEAAASQAEGMQQAPPLGAAPAHATGLANGVATAGSAALPNGGQAAGSSALHGHPSMASEEGELLADMQALDEAYKPQAAADPAAASERLKKWQAGQIKQKLAAEDFSDPAAAQPNQEAGADELEAELEGLDEPVQSKQMHIDPAVAIERRKKLQQQLQALSAQKAA